MFSNRLKIQLQIDELRAELAGTRDAQKREDLRKKTGVSGAAKEILTLMGGVFFPGFFHNLFTVQIFTGEANASCPVYRRVSPGWDSHHY